MIKKALFFLFFVTGMLSLPAIAKRFTYGFHPAQLVLHFPFTYHWEAVPNDELRSILTQPFHFLSKGAQSYVFESQDGRYVIKLFRYDRRVNPLKLKYLFQGCELAYRRARAETGLLYVHVNPTPMKLPILHCTGPLGRKYQFPLDEMRFAVQKKAKGFQQTLLEAKDDPPEMKKRILQFLTLLETRSNREIFNADPSLSRNFGFLEDRAIEIDFGNYRYSEGAAPDHEVARFGAKLRKWLEKEMPEWISFLDEELSSRSKGC